MSIDQQIANKKLELTEAQSMFSSDMSDADSFEHNRKTAMLAYELRLMRAERSRTIKALADAGQC